MGKFDDPNQRLQRDNPYLWGALYGLLLSIVFAVTDAAFGERLDGQTLLLAIATIASMSLAVGSITRARQKRRR